MSKKEEYYGIYFNDDIPKTDKVNKYSKEVKVEFEGKAYIVEEKDDEVIKTEIENGYKLTKEKDYEIEFTNENGKTYTLQVRIETSYLFFILLLFLLGFLIGLILTRPLGDGNSILDRFYNFISLSVIDLNINRSDEDKIEEKIEKKPKKQYEFDVTFKNIDSDDINLTNSISGKALAKNKIAPRSKWKFFNSTKYQKKYSRYEI